MKKIIYDKILEIAERNTISAADPVLDRDVFLETPRGIYPGFYRMMPLREALDIGTELTGDEVPKPLEFLRLSSMGTTICLFHRGEVYLDGRAIVEGEAG